ncbi:prophage DNA circulation protein [Angulomicrobium tetraedrale]|uniref:Prophage DNA circulation protein n=1 Tax=Ancylobacter tetraedralis TaxID=217068 RepID=A0A839Z9W2_9HYPH|nr:hypothetical protein [Ancylobacter tetraedralis]MBB3771515.1 prophage DNA circulation protein [Ancylobacter tetraedralis]
MDWLADLIDRFVTAPDDLLLARRRLDAIRLGGTAGASAYLEACRLLGEAASDSAGLIAALDDVEDPSTLDSVGLLVIACFASVKQDYAARPDAQRARAALAARADPVIEAAGTKYGYVLQDWLTALAGQAALQLSEIATTRAPLVRVETGVSLPATVLAWRLYGDPARDAELVTRNRTGTAMVMPVVLEAIAP